MPGSGDHPDTTLLHARRVECHGISRAPLHMTAGYLTAEPSGNAWTRDLSGHLVFPGFINAHDHLQLNCFPPVARSGPFPNSYGWIDAFQPYHADPAVQAARAIPADVRHWHGALKNLLCGVTTVAHHDPWHPVFATPAFPVRVLREFGWSHSLGLGLAAPGNSAPRYGPEVCASFSATSPDHPWIIHLAEGTDATAAAELGRLEALGCLAANTVLVHGVGLTEADIARVLARGAGVVWCPGSNLLLLGRTLTPGRLLAAGRLALGSDSRLAGSFDLLEDLRFAANHALCAPHELLALVTAAASRLLRFPHVGGLAPGQCADLLIVEDTGGAPCAALCGLQRTDIRAVIRGGAPAIADPDFADWFAACGIDALPIRLDGRSRLCDRTLLGPAGSAALEPGLEMGKEQG